MKTPEEIAAEMVNIDSAAGDGRPVEVYLGDEIDHVCLEPQSGIASANGIAADARDIIARLVRRERAEQAPPSEIVEVARLLRTQDNRATEAPIFIVQEKIRVYGFDPAYTDDVVWIDSECWEATPDEHAEFEAADEEPDGWTRTGYRDEWHFVTACFTEAGCAEYIRRNGHNHRELRIYAASSYRNDEWQAVRSWLLRQTAPAPSAPPRPGSVGSDPLFLDEVRAHPTMKGLAGGGVRGC